MTIADRLPRLLHVREIPAWMRDNDYIRTHYRPPLPSLRLCFHTAFFTWNNDTINVWSHFVGCFLCLISSFLLIGATSVSAHFPTVAAACSSTTAQLSSSLGAASQIFHQLRSEGLRNVCLQDHPQLKSALSALLTDHRFGMLPLLVTAVFCMAASTLFHAFWVYSPAALKVLGRLDFIGISVLCCGHGFTGIYYLFYCQPHIANKYYNFILAAEVATLFAILSPGFASPKARPIRALTFCVLGCSVLFPIAHAGSLHQWQGWDFEVASLSALFSLSVYAVGAVIYVSRFPECCRVGKHDRFGASHQLMHIAVMFGVAVHLVGCWILLKYRLHEGCTASPLLEA